MFNAIIVCMTVKESVHWVENLCEMDSFNIDPPVLL